MCFETQDLKRIPIPVADFEVLRKSGQIYVDKTALFFDLVTCGQPVFFSRPRRFGKSLLLSTIASLFEHGVTYFEGLEIEKLWHEKPCKVLRLDFSMFPADAEDFEGNFLAYFKEQCERAGLEYASQASNAPALLRSVLSKELAQSVVLLIDEYDRPLIDNLGDEAAFRKVRQKLRDFYLNVKGNKDQLRFLMVTEIARFNQAALFSAPNVFKDVSFDSHYGALLGFTDEELTKYFTPYIRNYAVLTGDTEEGVREKLKAYYDGYCFDLGLSTRVYNSWSVMNLLKDASQDYPYRSYWVETGSTSALLQHYLTHDMHAEGLLEMLEDFREADAVAEISLDELTNPRDLDTAEDRVMLCQLGYLTFKERLDSMSLSLGYPNREIRGYMAKTFVEYVLSLYRKRKDSLFTSGEIALFQKALMEKDTAQIATILGQCLQQLTYDERALLARDQDYVAMIYLVLRLMGQSVTREEHLLTGRTDLTLSFRNVKKGYVCVFEFRLLRDRHESEHEKLKIKAEALLEEAREQIISRNYHLSGSPGRTVLCYAVVLSESHYDVVAISSVEAPHTQVQLK